MLASIKKFFEDRVAPEAAEPSPEAREHGLRLAAAALLFEISRADHEVKEEERTVMRAAIQGTFGLDREETEELMRLAEQESREATSLYEFTRLVNDHYSIDEKRELIAAMWRVAYADAELDKYEEHLIRRVAELIYVPHEDFIRSKGEVKAELGL